MEAREILREFSERASKYTINLDGRIQRQTDARTCGGSSFVYLGTLSPGGTTVAIKTALDVPQADQKTIKKMLREAHVWSKLDHPNVLPLLGITTDFDLTVSLVTTWLERGSAHCYVQERHNDPRPLIRDIAEGLSYLHNHPRGPIFHGDLKGDNVLIAEDGRALLTDFGLSIHFNSSLVLTPSPSRVGSWRWMAPELVESTREIHATAASDIWAFGMTALELFTGKLPYHQLKTITAICYRILESSPERPSDEDTCSRMTDEWWALCSRCWGKEPSSRISVSGAVELTRQLLTAVIVIMGPTGSGKSNFINKLTGSGEEPGAHRLESCTQGVREFTVNVPGGTRYVFVDTPGFDDTHQSDCDVLRTIADWLDIKYRRGVKLAGVVYTHRISDSRMSNAACKNLDLFCHLCGDKAAQCVRMVTTMWDSLKSENSTVYRSRLSQLEGSYWKPLIGLGARHEQFFNTQESAWHIVHGLVQTPSSVDAARKMEGGSAGQVLIQGEMVDGRRKIEGGSARQVLLIQEEMVDAWKELNETSAGQALYSRFQEVLLEYKKTLKKLADALAEKDPSTVEQLRADYCKVEAQMQKVMKDREGMKISLRRRIASFLFGRKTRSRKIELNLTPGDLDTNQVN